MRKVVVTPRIDVKGLELLAAQPDIETELVEDISGDALEKALADADGAIVRAIPIPRALLEKAPRLKVVSRHGVGFDNVDIGYLNEQGIPLTLTVNANALSVAEHTLFFILALAKNAFAYDQAVRGGNFRIRESLACFDIAGKTLLIAGFGRIGRAVTARARAFDMRVVVFDPLVPVDAIRAAGAEPTQSLEAALPDCDYFTVHLPMLPETRGMIGAAELALMRPTASVINTARGGIVDEQALIAALTGGRLRGAALDVFDPEPPRPDNPLFALDNVILSPHCAGLTKEGAERMAVESVENVLAVFNGRLDPSTVANREVLPT